MVHQENLLFTSLNFYRKMILPKILDALPKVNFYLGGDGPFMKKILPSLEKYDNFHWLGKTSIIFFR